jgi:hypothetical protein
MDAPYGFLPTSKMTADSVYGSVDPAVGPRASDSDDPTADVQLPPSRPGRGNLGDVADAGSPDVTGSASPSGLGIRPGSAGAPGVPASSKEAGFGGLFHLSDAASNGLMAAGLGMMASRSPFLANAIGEGGLAGLSAYSGSKREEVSEKQVADKLAQHAEETRKKFDLETAREARMKEALEQGRVPAGYRAINGTLQPIPGGPADPEVIKRMADAKQGEGKASPGYKINDDGTWSPIKGGPHDPDTIAAQLRAKVPELTDDDKAMIKRTASLYNIMGPQALTNLGRGAQSGELVKAIKTEAARQDTEQGISPEMRATKMAEYQGLKSGERTAAVAAATVSRAAFEARNMIPQALEAQTRLPRTDWVPINKMIENWQSGVYSSPQQADAAAANFSLVNTYVRAIAPTGVPPDSVRKHAYDMLSGAMSLDSYKAVIQRMDKEMEAAEKSPRQVVDMFRNLYGGGAGLGGNAPPGAPNAPAPGSPTTRKLEPAQ